MRAVLVTGHGARRARLAAITAQPAGEQVTQQARTLLRNRDDRGADVTFLTRDREATFTAGSAAVPAAEGVPITKGPGAGAPVRARSPNDGSPSARRERLDPMLITSERHPRLILDQYAGHDHSCRPHRARHQGPPAGRPHPPAPGANARVLRRDRLGGLIHEHAQVA